ncbi:MAG: hypothetical protein KKI06_08245 [Euryarchaeota archaeon]|nr:hypothetical protein [Euryarchaeota archaeon]MBU4223309.1 hypothetical protein [Euryarchaeota archaeon]
MVIKKISGIVLILFIYFLNPTAIAEECTSCHNIRHGLTGNSCDNCHYNTTFVNGKHIQKPFSPGFVHDGFDWEGDNANEKAPYRLNESCPVCHVSMLEHTSPTLNVCEDCHVKELKRGKLITIRKNKVHMLWLRPKDRRRFVPRCQFQEKGHLWWVFCIQCT